MKMTLSTNQAARMLCDDKNANWSWNGAMALCEWIEAAEDYDQQEAEFDPVAIRCDWSEHASLEDWAADYGFEPETPLEDERAREIEIQEYISDRGSLICFNGGVIVSSF